MTDIETRLREGLRAEAARVQPHLLRELKVPPRRRLRAPWRRPGPLLGPRVLPWLAPVAAALAVVAVIAGVRLGVGDGPAVRPRVTPAVTAAAPAVPVPPYYVSANLHSQDRAWVNNSATGQVIAKVGVKGQLPIAISATADDRTFALVFQDLYRPAFTTFMRLTLRADGHPAAFQRLPVNVPPGTSLESAGGTAEGVALSPDGQTLALVLSVQPESGLTNNNARLELISLRTGVTRTWAAPAGDVITDLSWARGSQTLAFLAGPQGSGHPAPATPLRILDVSRPPGGLLASSTPVPLDTSGGQVTSLLVTDNGARAVGWIWMPVKRGSTTRGTLILAEFSTGTGQRLRIFSRLNSVHSVPPYGEVFSADPSGQHILLYSLGILGTKTVYTTPQVQTISPRPGSSAPPRTQTLGPFRSVQAKTDAFFARLDNGQLTRLPSPAQDDSEFGAW